MRLAGVDIRDPQPVGGGDICEAFRGELGGRVVFAKTTPGAPAGFFRAEARGLALLQVDGAPPTPDVLAVGEDGLVLDWISPGQPSPRAAFDFGRRLAALHAAALDSFGAPADGFIGSLPLPNPARPTWSQFYVDNRISPYLTGLSSSERMVIERLCDRMDDVAGPPEPPARIHGDLWSGNLLWASDGQVWLVDAASAHGGHRETDLAMLRLFGAPHLDAILAAYQEVSPLAEGWQQRVALHQVHPLLVHACLFGGGYGGRAATAAETALAG